MTQIALLNMVALRIIFENNKMLPFFTDLSEFKRKAQYKNKAYA